MLAVNAHLYNSGSLSNGYGPFLASNIPLPIFNRVLCRFSQPISFICVLICLKNNNKIMN